MTKLTFEEVKPLFIKAVKKAYSVDEIIFIFINEIYQKGFNDGLDMCISENQ